MKVELLDGPARGEGATSVGRHFSVNEPTELGSKVNSPWFLWYTKSCHHLDSSHVSCPLVTVPFPQQSSYSSQSNRGHLRVPVKQRPPLDTIQRLPPSPSQTEATPSHLQLPVRGHLQIPVKQSLPVQLLYA